MLIVKQVVQWNFKSMLKQTICRVEPYFRLHFRSCRFNLINELFWILVLPVFFNFNMQMDAFWYIVATSSNTTPVQSPGSKMASVHVAEIADRILHTTH